MASRAIAVESGLGMPVDADGSGIGSAVEGASWLVEGPGNVSGG